MDPKRGRYEPKTFKDYLCLTIVASEALLGYGGNTA
jgi:hypothetical protein